MLRATIITCCLFFITAGVRADSTGTLIPNLKQNDSDLNALLKIVKPRQECGAETNDVESKEFLGVSKSVGGMNGQEITFKQRKQCLISANKAKVLWNKNKLTFVDIRNKVEYGVVHIPRSLNIPVHLIKTKSFLKNKYIVIVAKGHSLHEPLLTCINLYKAGYGRVAVLSGGLYHWSQEAPVMGNAKLAEFDRLSPAEYNKIQREREWVVINAQSDGENIDSLFPGQYIVKYNGNVTSLKNTIKKLIAGGEASKKSSYLLVGSQNVNATILANIIRKEGGKSVYFLNSSINDYRKYMSKQDLMLAKVAAGPKRVKRCGG